MAAIGSHHRLTKDRSDTWITPRAITAALGPFDLDPCEADAMPWRHAARGITSINDGLAQPWEGRVWLNPPYHRDRVELWMKRLADHGRGTALVFARTETMWFHRQVWMRASGLLFLHGRLSFHRQDGLPAGHNSGGPSVLVAYGTDDVDRLRASGLQGWLVSGWQS